MVVGVGWGVGVFGQNTNKLQHEVEFGTRKCFRYIPERRPIFGVTLDYPDGLQPGSSEQHSTAQLSTRSGKNMEGGIWFWERNTHRTGHGDGAVLLRD